MSEASQDPRKAATVDDERLNDLARSTSGWFWEMDAQLRFRYLSPNVKDITGVEPEWHYGKTREELGIPQSVGPAKWRAHLAALRRGEPFRDFVFQRSGPDGLKWMQTSGIPIFNESGAFMGYRGNATDITAQIAAEQRSQALEDAIEHIAETFALWDSDDRLVSCNARFREFNARIIEATRPGISFSDYVQAAVDAGLFPQALGQEKEWLAERLERHYSTGQPLLIERADGDWIQVTDHHLPDGSIATISTDVTEGHRLRQELEWLASNDSLTQVLNRRGFMSSANTDFARSRRYQRPLAFMMLDIDHFKRLNDEFGHRIGDEALNTVANACKIALRDSDYIGRLGGEEFGVMLPETQSHAAMLVAERLRRTVELQTGREFTSYGPITVSIGIACLSATPGDMEDLMSVADGALYKAKQGGRNRVEISV